MLSITRPIGRTVILAVIVLVGLVGIGEIVLRLPAVTTELPPPHRGSTRDTLEIQLDKLEHFADQGPIDCLIIGSSMVRYSVDPATIEARYTALTGHSIRCFSFSELGLTASNAHELISYFIPHYQPQLIIYGLSTRDLAPPQNKLVLADWQWLQYAKGNQSLEGWLWHHSKVLQTSFYVIEWILDDPYERLKTRDDLNTEIRTDGYLPSYETMETMPRSMEEETTRVTRAFQKNYSQADEVAALASILRLHDPAGTQILLVEIPVMPQIIKHVLGTDVYEQFDTELHDMAALYNIIYLPSSELKLIPSEGWRDAFHMNDTGAQLFSTWLGDHLAEEVETGALKPVNTRDTSSD